jgi:hypothetical protein
MVFEIAKLGDPTGAGRGVSAKYFGKASSGSGTRLRA